MPWYSNDSEKCTTNDKIIVCYAVCYSHCISLQCKGVLMQFLHLCTTFSLVHKILNLHCTYIIISYGRDLYHKLSGYQVQKPSSDLLLKVLLNCGKLGYMARYR